MIVCVGQSISFVGHANGRIIWESGKNHSEIAILASRYSKKKIFFVKRIRLTRNFLNKVRGKAAWFQFNLKYKVILGLPLFLGIDHNFIWNRYHLLKKRKKNAVRIILNIL